MKKIIISTCFCVSLLCIGVSEATTSRFGHSCTEHSDCISNRNQNGETCSKGQCYCRYRNTKVYQVKSQGTCSKMDSEGTVIKSGKDEYIVIRDAFDLKSAENVCSLYGKKLLSLKELGCPTSGKCSEQSLIMQINEKLNPTSIGSVGPWTRDKKDEKTAYGINIVGQVKEDITYYPGHDALCH